MKRIFAMAGLFLFWNVAIALPVLTMRPPWGILLAVAVSALLLFRYVLRVGRPGEARRRATLRLRLPHTGKLGWLLVYTVLTLGLSWILGEIYTGLVAVPPGTFDPFGPLTRTLGGRVSAAVLAVGIAPILEEFVFRGLLQRPLERRWGHSRGIVGAATVFALAHMLPWVFPLHLFLGLAFGFAVYATRSIWAGVLLHTANNGLAVIGLFSEQPESPGPTIWERAPDPAWWIALALLIPAASALFWAGKRMLEASDRGGTPVSPRTLIAHSEVYDV